MSFKQYNMFEKYAYISITYLNMIELRFEIAHLCRFFSSFIRLLIHY